MIKMNRNLRAFGLAALLAMAVGGLAVPAAQAEEFKASEYPATLSGEQTSTHVITFGGGPKIECQSVSNSGVLEEASESFGVSVGASECSQTIGGFKYESNTTFECGGIYTHLNTPFGTQTNCTSEYTHDYETYVGGNERLCVYSMEDLGTYEGVGHENLGGTNGIEFTYEITGIPYELVFGSTLLCGPASSTATYTGTSVYTATNEEGDPIAFELG